MGKLELLYWIQIIILTIMNLKLFIYFWHDREANESFDLEDVVAWMPIPSFDEILEANKDVLERIKEKGD